MNYFDLLPNELLLDISNMLESSSLTCFIQVDHRTRDVSSSLIRDRLQKEQKKLDQRIIWLCSSITESKYKLSYFFNQTFVKEHLRSKDGENIYFDTLFITTIDTVINLFVIYFHNIRAVKNISDNLSSCSNDFNIVFDLSNDELFNNTFSDIIRDNKLDISDLTIKDIRKMILSLSTICQKDPDFIILDSIKRKSLEILEARRSWSV